MTVAELIEMLANEDPSATVHVVVDDGKNTYMDVADVYDEVDGSVIIEVD